MSESRLNIFKGKYQLVFISPEAVWQLGVEEDVIY